MSEQATSTEIKPQIEASWLEVLKDEFQKPYFKQIKQFIIEQKTQGKTIYPPGSQIFNAFNLTPFDKVKAVILGQDPYHGPRQAHGLCFSVQDGIKAPPSLINIYKEIESDLGVQLNHGTGNLTKWAEQGVLLLNAILTVNAREPASHRKAGWELFTNAAIQKLSEHKQGLVFILWGKFAQEKAALIDGSKHKILAAPHPSPYSASYGFFGCKHFSKANEYLQENGIEAIDWHN